MQEPVLLHRHNLFYVDNDGREPECDVVRSEASSDFEDYFNELRRVFSSFAIDRALNECGIENWFDCLAWRALYSAQIPKYVLATYQRYGFWRSGESFPAVLKEFLSRHKADVWKELRQLETRLRRLVTERLKAYYGGGDDWFDKMRLPECGSADSPWKKIEEQKKSSFQQIVKGMRARRQKDMPDVSIEYLDCTYLDDLLNLMLIEWHWRPDGNRNWEGFSALFDGDIQKCRKYMLAAVGVRNPEAHFVEYPAVLKARFEEAYRYLSGALDRVERNS